MVIFPLSFMILFIWILSPFSWWVWLKVYQSCLSFQSNSSWIHCSFVSFFNSILFISALIFIFLSFYSFWAFFVVLFQVPLSVKLDCFFEPFLAFFFFFLRQACNAVNFPVRIAFPVSHRYWFVCSHFHMFQGIFRFLPWSCCWCIRCLITCCLVFMSLCILQCSSYNWFLVL